MQSVSQLFGDGEDKPETTSYNSKLFERKKKIQNTSQTGAASEHHMHFHLSLTEIMKCRQLSRTQREGRWVGRTQRDWKEGLKTNETDKG